MQMTQPTRSPHVSPNRLIASDPVVIEKVRQVIALVYEGNYLKQALKVVGLTRFMFSSCISGERELAAQYAQARKVSADFLVDEALDAVMNEENQMKARNIADMNRWAAGKFDSKYNDRIDINLNQTLDISGTLLEARQRMLRPVCDQLTFEDAQVIDYTGSNASGATDKQSAIASDPPGEPDIFAPAPSPEPAAPDAALPDEDHPDIFS